MGGEEGTGEKQGTLEELQGLWYGYSTFGMKRRSCKVSQKPQRQGIEGHGESLNFIIKAAESHREC